MTNQPWNDEDFDTPHLDPEDDPAVVLAMKVSGNWYDQDNAPESPLEQDLEEAF